MTTGKSLVLHRETVRPEWIDYNGHMSEAYYVLVFGHATDALYDHVGLDAAYRRAEGRSLYTVEAHLHYLREVGPGATLRCATRVLGFDLRRIHIHHALFAGRIRAAVTELMALHVDTALGRAVAMPGRILERLGAIGGGVVPAPASRAIGLIPANH